MMYIVLIAMLALNVDTKVLKKFILINQSFESTNADKVIDNGRKVKMEFLENEKKFDPDEVYKGQPNPTKI